MIINKLRSFNTRDFDYNKSSRTFATEASDIQFVQPYRLFDDACDVGILLESANTGKIEPFYYDSCQKDRENDVLYWLFKSVNPSLNAQVKIFND